MRISEEAKVPLWCSKASSVLLALAVVFAIVLRTAGTVEKRTIDYDESISYLAATCHQGQYANLVTQRLPPFGTWAKASDWKTLIQPEHLFCFGQIARDLAHNDIHPPLYFWILHLWSRVFGVHPWTGPLLNIAFALATLSLLFWLAHTNLTNPEEASVVALTWALSPAVISISLEARQYDLVALIAVLFVCRVIKCADLSKPFQLGDAVVLAILAAAGALTHFYFSLVVLGCIIFLAMKLVKRKPDRLIMALACIGVGCLLFVLLHPEFYQSIILQRQYVREPFGLQGVIGRMTHVWIALTDFFLPWHSLVLISGFTLSVSALGIWAALAGSKQPVTLVRIVGAFGGTGMPVSFFFFWIYGATVALYLAFLSPAHAMGPRYLSMAWPFFGFVTVFLLRSFGSKRRLLTYLFCSGMLLSGSASVLHTIHQQSTTRDWTALLLRSDRILVDNVARGVLLPIMWQLPDDKLVFAADQTFLLDHQDMWVSHLDGAVYVSEGSDGTAHAREQNIVSIINQNHQAVLLDRGTRGPGRVFSIETLIH